jgi:hypothetical protein
VLAFFANLLPCLIGLEACTGLQIFSLKGEGAPTCVDTFTLWERADVRVFKKA